MTIRRKRIRVLVRRLLKESSVNEPPVPVIEIAKSNEVELRLSSHKNSKISGFLFSGGNKTILGVNAAHHKNRQRFTIAHELGHFLLHSIEVGGIHIDHTFQVKLRSDVSSTGRENDEREANLFAAELLMPIDFLIKELSGKKHIDIEDDEFLLELAQRYRVSRQAMAFRLANLDFLTL